METDDALRYENRLGDVWLVQEGKTPTGKPKYYAGRKLTGKPVAALPEGYELHEKPDTAQVVVRKSKPSPITEFERRQAEEIVRRESGMRHFIVAIEDDALVVYTPSLTEAELDQSIRILSGSFFASSSRLEKYRESRLRECQYSKMLRFELIDPDTRAFSSQRWCFLGSIDDWIFLGKSGPLSLVVKTYAKHLNSESFFELI